MLQQQSGPDAQPVLQEVLGYLNFSSGSSDSRFLRNINTLFRYIESDPDSVGRAPEILASQLERCLEELQREGTAFAEAEQARRVFGLVLGRFRPYYRDYHRDLLFHQTDADLWRPLLLGRVFEAVLSQGPPWTEASRILAGALTRINDFVGYRPVAVLEGERRTTPYAHEWVGPIPLYIEGVGVAVGRYEALVGRALEVLRRTDPALLDQAWFDPDLVAELAVDPRAYDFDHPAAKRPNHQFGLWDPHTIDNRGRYRRFVVQQITLDSILARVTDASELPEGERLSEASVVLAGTILMASGLSGSGPDTHDSSVTLGGLVAHIASYRDEFYQRQLGALPRQHAHRLRAEAAVLKQPFGGARQHLNQSLSRLRAVQLQHVHLARLYALMGYPAAAQREVQAVPVAAARLASQIDSDLTAVCCAVDAGELAPVPAKLGEIEQLLRRAIECGAVVDPWNVVGFGGNFSLFPALENSVHDHRVNDLVDRMGRVFTLAARAWTAAAANDDTTGQRALTGVFDRLAQWWDQFATASVSGVRRLVGAELRASTQSAAEALQAWNGAGATAGDIAFWRSKVGLFSAPKAFCLVVDALLKKRDHRVAMALLMQWLNQADTTLLAAGEDSFHRMAQRWLQAVASDRQDGAADVARWQLIRRFFDHLEANAGTYWEVPRLELPGQASPAAAGRSGGSGGCDHGDPIVPDDWDEGETYRYSAAYEQVVFKDSTDDGVDGSLLGAAGSLWDDTLADESGRLEERLAFLATLARLWRETAIDWGGQEWLETPERTAFRDWQRQAAAMFEGLVALLEAVDRHSIPVPSGSRDALFQCDRQQMIKESLLERILSTCVGMAEAERYLAAAAIPPPTVPVDAERSTALLQAVLGGDVPAVRRNWGRFLEDLSDREILYTPLGKGGCPRHVVTARVTRRLIQDLLGALPRLGLLRETRQLLATAQAMEINRPPGPVVVTEFDQLFATGMKASVECIVAAAGAEHAPAPIQPQRGRHKVSDARLIEGLRQFAEQQLNCWLRHSRRLRLSVVEKVAAAPDWQSLVDFIRHYGHELFTQQFLALPNTRAILLHGVDAWLENLEENPTAETQLDLLSQIDRTVPRARVIAHLTLALEAVMENEAEFRDFNATTVQSDRGELFFEFIDFLRLKSEYDRLAWNLRPLVIVHEVLVRRQRMAAAETWRRALMDRTADTAEELAERLHQLKQTYGIDLATVRDRIAERFVQPLAVDRIRALVHPAVEEARHGGGTDALQALTAEIDSLAREPKGAGLDLPGWLEALEEEVAALVAADPAPPVATVASRLSQVCLSWENVCGQLPVD